MNVTRNATTIVGRFQPSYPMLPFGLSSRTNCHLHMLLLTADLVQEATYDTCPRQAPFLTSLKEVKRFKAPSKSRPAQVRTLANTKTNAS